MTGTEQRPAGAPMLCLVTPGPRALTIAGNRSVGPLLALVERAIEAGIDLVQLREPQLSARQLYELAAAAVARSRRTATRIVVNDRLDVALAAGADGVHLGRRSLPAARARGLVPPGFLVGCSVHSLEELRDVPRQDVDYLVAGTVYWTASKPSATQLLRVDGVAALARATDLPLLAIGGVTLERIPELVGAGAAGIAAIGLFADADPAHLPHVVSQARHALTRLEQFPKLSRKDDDWQAATEGER